MRNIIRSGIALAIVAAAVPAFALVTAGAVQAAPMSTPHSLSGTVLEGGGWFESSTVRTVDSTTDIVLSLTSIPSHGIQWRLVNARNGQVFTDTSTFTSTGTQTIATDVLATTLFQNDFAQGDDCNFDCGSYNFSGSESY